MESRNVTCTVFNKLNNLKIMKEKKREVKIQDYQYTVFCLL